MPNENRKTHSTYGGRKSMYLREMTAGNVLINRAGSNKTNATNRQKPKKRKWNNNIVTLNHTEAKTQTLKKKSCKGTKKLSTTPLTKLSNIAYGEIVN